MSKRRGERSSSANARSVCRARPAIAAASGPLPLTSPITNHHASFVDLEHVVEVAADLVALAGRPIPRRDTRAGNRGKRRRQQARLQRSGDVVTLRVEAGVVERQPGASRELFGEREIGRTETPPGPRRHERQRAEHPTAGAERDAHVRA